MTEQTTPMEVLPCGCRIGTVGDAFVIQACGAGEACPTIQYVRAETERQGKPLTTLDMR